MEQSNINNHSNEDIDNALRLLESGDRMTDEELDQLSADDNVADAMADLLDLKMAVLSANQTTMLHVDDEWERFKGRAGSRKKPDRTRTLRRVLYGSVAAVAASVLLLWGWRVWSEWMTGSQMPKGMVLRAVKRTGDPVLTIEDDRQINLRKDPDDATLANMGVRVDSHGEMYMVGRSDETPSRLALTIPRGQIYRLVLSDGSEVWLNNDCRLVYPSRFVGHERWVRIEGEAYFKVAHDAAHPFVVETGDMEVRVVGTEFNVRNYGVGDTHVTLIKGSVDLTSTARHQVRLTPGKDARLNADGSFGVADVDIESYLYWHDGFFYFDDIPLESVMQDIGRWYNLNVIFHNEQAKALHLHFLADKRGGVDHVIKLLNSMGKVTVTHRDNTLIVD